MAKHQTAATTEPDPVVEPAADPVAVAETIVTDPPNGLAVEMSPDGELTDTTGSKRLEIRFGGKIYTHKRDDDLGRWVYRND